MKILIKFFVFFSLLMQVPYCQNKGWEDDKIIDKPAKFLEGEAIGDSLQISDKEKIKIEPAYSANDSLQRINQGKLNADKKDKFQDSIIIIQSENEYNWEKYRLSDSASLKKMDVNYCKDKVNDEISRAKDAHLSPETISFIESKINDCIFYYDQNNEALPIDYYNQGGKKKNLSRKLITGIGTSLGLYLMFADLRSNNDDEGDSLADAWGESIAIVALKGIGLGLTIGFGIGFLLSF